MTLLLVLTLVLIGFFLACLVLGPEAPVPAPAPPYPPSYTIRTVLDFEQVPDDRLEDCLAQFVTTLLQARACRPLRLEGFIWTDDGQPGYRAVHLRRGRRTQIIANPDFPPANP
jgi:hypothetical protein